MADITVEKVATDLTNLFKDALYITVGFGVLATQKLQAQRGQLQQQVDARIEAGKVHFDKASQNFESQLSSLEKRLNALESRLDTALDKVETALPEQARDAMKQARDAAKTAREQVRGLVRSKTTDVTDAVDTATEGDAAAA
jgi:ElaB/YqjD/DUF883 family membrane-anchored ribosome-binding protein